MSDLERRVGEATKRWNCLIAHARKLAKSHAEHKFSEVAQVMVDCGVPEEDRAYYMKAIWDCRKGRSW